MKRHKAERTAARRVAFMGILLGLAAALSFLEGLLPVLPMLPPGIKPGLSNIVTMYALLFMGSRSGFTVAVLKSLFVLLTRGPTAACMSLAGGLLSVAVMAVLLQFDRGLSRPSVSVSGAVAHNVGQLLMAALVLQNGFAFGWLPVMVLSGVAMGLLTALLLGVLEPYLRRLDLLVQKRTC